MTIRPALALAGVVASLALAGCGANSGNGDSVTTNDASSAPVCRLGTTPTGQCLSAPAYKPTPSPTSTPAASPAAVRCRHRAHHHHHNHCHT
jgi:hypothetical protein